MARTVLLRLLGRRRFDLVGLESAVAESIALRGWHLALTVHPIMVIMIVLLPVQRIVFITERSFSPCVHDLLIAKALEAILVPRRYVEIVSITGVVVSTGRVLIEELLYVGLGGVLCTTDGPLDV